jgi:hypothetical protein
MPFCAKAFLLANIVLISPRLSPAQHTPTTSHEVEAFAERARAEGIVGKNVRIPDRILNELFAEAPTDYPSCDREARKQFEAHQVLVSAGLMGGIAIWGGGGCFCSPTGNCGFWIYELKNGAYRTVLRTSNVSKFGLLKSRNHGFPDLVVWSHGSATDYEARLFRFNGRQYVVSGGWGEEYEYLDEHDQVVRPKKPRITSHFANTNEIPALGEP